MRKHDCMKHLCEVKRHELGNRAVSIRRILFVGAVSCSGGQKTTLGREVNLFLCRYYSSYDAVI
jgi:hypothetical protein